MIDPRPTTVTLRRRARGQGMTVLEIMIVLAVLGVMSYLAYSGFRVLSSVALVEDTNDLGSVMRRTQALALESGEPVRLVIDLDKQAYWVEACFGTAGMTRVKEEQAVDPETVKKELERAAERVRSSSAGQLAAESSTGVNAKLTALAGQKVGGRICRSLQSLQDDESEEVSESFRQVFSGDAMGRDLSRRLQTDRGVKVKEVWVQHLEDSVSSGKVSISFFPLGWAEKAIIELSDGSSTHSILLFGLTGRIEIRDGAVRDPDEHMLRNAKGDDEEDR